MGKKYVIGVDFGTESGRALIVDVATGEEAGVHVTPYPHGVIDEKLPATGRALGVDWALQHPGDYVEVLRRSVPEALRLAGVRPEQVIGIGIDFTASTVLPVDSAGVPLCVRPDFAGEPHAYVKLWKHHAAQEEADRINEVAGLRGESFLSRYGGRTSSEWLLAKAWQVLNEAPHVYEAADRFVEAADWVVFRLTGELRRSSCCAGYKAFWHADEGYPSHSFFRELDPRLESFPETKLRGTIAPPGAKAGELTEEAARLLGLPQGVAVAVGIIDAHAAVPGAGATEAGQLVMAMGTSLCHMLLAEKEIHAEGICGVVRDGIVPGLFGYEAGQPAVGDMFGWYVEQAAAAYAKEEAGREGLSLHGYLERLASVQKPGQHGLLAVDWWNGNRSVLVRADLSGLLVGLTLQTKPEDIYRALLEAAAYGTRKIIEAFERAGLPVRELYACGGLPQRNRLLMQIFADVTGREIKIAASGQTPALGAAMFGAVAAGTGRGGYANVREAAARMARVQDETYIPNAEHAAVYDELYAAYSELHDYFGRSSGVMQKLKSRRG